MTFSLAGIRALLRSRDDIFRDAYEGRQFDSVYFAMLVFACLIALLGLLLNSPAIIIGAMLISPLMGPILSCGLALTTADWDLGRKAARNVGFSLAEVIVIAILATRLSPLKDLTPEILARTNPNLMDLLVAFFSGLAGTLALSSRKGGLTIIPGVAIATAVMPPLATVGYGLSTGQWAVARGAFMLFFTNFMAIVISAELIFLLVGFRPGRRQIPEGARLLVRYRTLIAVSVLLALSVPLLQTLVHAARQVQLRQVVAATLQDEVNQAGRRVDRFELQVAPDAVAVDVAVQTAEFIDTPETRKWEAALATRIGRPVRLQVQQLQLARKAAAPSSAERHDFLGGGAIRPRPPEPPPSPVAEIEKLQAKMQESLRVLLGPAGADPLRIRSLGKQPDGTLLLDLTGREPAPTDDAVWKVAAAALAKEFSSPVRLTGSIVVGNAARFIKYRRNAIRPASQEVRETERFLSQWKDRPTLRYAFLANSPADSTASRRLLFLRQKFPRGIYEQADWDLPADQLPGDGVRLQIVHIVDATAGTLVPAVKPATSEHGSQAQ